MFNKKKKLLILNGSHSEIPLILAAKRLGFYVITTGNAPSLIGHSYADEYHNADFSDKNVILNLAKYLKIDAICSSANDFGAITSAYVAEKLSLPGHDSYKNTLILHHKDLFKVFALENGIPTAKAISFNSLEAALKSDLGLTYPLIVKPIDLTGGKGVVKVSSRLDYEVAVGQAFLASPLKRIVVEEFINGTQHSLSTYVVNGKIVFYFSDNEYSFLNPFLVSTSAAPAAHIDEVVDDLICASEKIIDLLALCDGIFHIQYLFLNGKASIIEITRRCSGDLYPYPVNWSTGIDWAEWIIKAEAGLDVSNFPQIKQTRYCGRHCLMAPKNGIIQNVIIDDCIKSNIYDEIVWWKENCIVDNYLTNKFGVYFLQFGTYEEMMTKVSNINSLIKVEIK